ncbi:thymidine phosphorylase [Treponema parvum]|uniref:thymidine phosphorylase n=1 Tax=Treponema parvum TaxID=138851 RepID=UPI001AEC0AFC|nr:thymidine phosphorylase [Treponema parvum]QTQ16378.1 thymidine phosphorylase [Treponema parvum]
MRVTDIIMKKRGTFVRGSDGTQKTAGNTQLTKEEIKFLIDGYVSSKIPEYQIASWLMAVYFNGMTFEETGALTECMLHSGEVIDLHDREVKGLTGPFVDKHSTGGVGDKISLPLAPIAACCGVQIPMMSGRALGHTGGTLDKLESVTGYTTSLSPKKFKELIAKTGFAMTGQNERIVPADKLLYALRDVTATVESVPLITSSILSKKVAEGSDALVFDVKYGSGAFMKSVADAELLASYLVKTAQAMGKKAAAFMTNMNTPLGNKIGNFLEIEETLDCLNGFGPEDVMELTYAFASKMVLFAEKAKTKKEALEMCKDAVASGKALKKFLENIEDQGGDVSRLLEDNGKRRSVHRAEFKAQKDGYLKIDAYMTGLAGVYLGVGRNKTTDKVCAEAGIILHKRECDHVKKGETIMSVYGKDEQCLSPAMELIEKSVSYSEKKVEKAKLIYKEIR